MTDVWLLLLAVDLLDVEELELLLVIVDLLEDWDPVLELLLLVAVGLLDV